MAQVATMELAPLEAARFESSRREEELIASSSGDETPTPALDASSPGTATPSDLSDHDDEHERQMAALPPVDGGKDAWLFLTACFAVEALVWGFPFSFGVFQEHYSTHPPFEGQPNIAVVGTCAMGIMYLTAPLILGTGRMFGRWTRYMPILGLLMMCLALAMSSFSQTVGHLIVTQGIIYGLGGGIAYCPCILYMDEWFVNRKGLAYGIMWSGTGLAGVILPLMMEALLATIGFRSTLRLWSGLLFLLTAPLSYFIKPRLPVSAKTTAKPFNLRFMRMPSFLLYQVFNIVEAMGFFLPGLYLPMYARSAFGAQGYASASTVLLVNVASVFGCVVMGWFTDRFHVTSCILLSTVGATVGVFLLWGLSVSLPMLYVFCVVYGLFAGSFTSCWPGIMKDVIVKGDREKHGIIDPSMVFGWLAAGRGVGNIISGPLSESLAARGVAWQGEADFGYGSGFGGLIVFTGVTALVGGGSWAWRRLGLL